MPATRYRVTASIGGWRSAPWPFGILEVTDTSLSLRSWHWSWWLADRDIPRDEIELIETSTRFGVTTLRLNVTGGHHVTLQFPTASRRALGDLRRRGYLPTESEASC